MKLFEDTTVFSGVDWLWATGSADLFAKPSRIAAPLA